MVHSALGVTAAVTGSKLGASPHFAMGQSPPETSTPSLSGPVSSARAERTAPGRLGKPFLFALNTGTIRGQKLSVPEQVDVVAKAGYDGIEPWMGDLSGYVESGGSLEDLGKRIADHGLTVMSAIGFAPWLVEDEASRTKGLDQLRREMEMIARLGGRWIAAPPAGVTQTRIPLSTAAERYRKVLELGDSMGVVPQLEVWGASQTLGRLADAVHVAIEAGHPRACLLLDVYQLYKGGSGFEGLRLVAGSAMHALHINDYPADPPRQTITDSHRVYPGDGIAPLPRILRILYESGFRGYLSLELFNREYWKQDALQVARTGLEKIQLVVQKALENKQA